MHVSINSYTYTDIYQTAGIWWLDSGMGWGVHGTTLKQHLGNMQLYIIL